MIAFIRPPEKSSESLDLQDVHRLVAVTLLPPRSDRANSAPPMAAWKSWLLAAWLVIAALWGITHAVGVLL
jgi:hypothetical protein